MLKAFSSIVSKHQEIKKPVARITLRQQQIIVECVEENPTLITKKFNNKLTKEKNNSDWQSLALLLNKENPLSARDYERWKQV